MKILAAAGAALSLGTAAEAGEIFGGIHAHDVDTVITRSGGVEDGIDFQIGYRSERIGGSLNQGVPSVYGLVSVNSTGHTNFAALGLSWKFGNKLYLRPGVGIAVHDGPGDFGEPGRVYLGSRILAELELGVGYQLNDRFAVEASWVHLSHAKFFGPQNPGQDNIGMRVNYRF